MSKVLRAAITFVICLIAVLSIPVSIIPDSALAQSAQPYNWRNVVINGGGFVPGIIFNKTEPNLIYARTDIGGAYRWNPSTNRWIPLLDWIGSDEWNLTGVESLATDPVDPNRVYVAAGTYTNEWTNMNGAILRSTDQGNTWQRADLPFKVGGNMPGRSMGERLAIDPNQNSILYLGARSGNGLWRSIDFGATWSKVTSFPNPGNYVENPNSSYTADIVGVVWVTFDPRTGTPGNPTQTIYAGVADKANSIYRSTDGGATWAAVPGQPTGYLPHHGVLASTGMLYITYSDGAGPYDGSKGDVWKYNTATGAWTVISPIPSTSGDDYFGYGGLAVDAQNPNTLMVAALNSWWPDTVIFRSTNGGATWTRIWDWAVYPNRTFRYVQDISAAPWLTFGTSPALPEITPKLGWMVGALEIDPFNSDRMMYGTGATIYGSDDLTAWDRGEMIHISVKVHGLEETAVLDLISPPSGAHLLSGLGDLNGFRHDDFDVAPAKIFTTPSFTAVSLDYAELASNFIVRVGNGDTSNGAKRIGFSYDGGANWFQGMEPGGVTGGGTVAAAADATRLVWSPDGAAVSFSTNVGGTWTASTGIPAGARVASDRVNPMKFYGFRNGTFYVSVNGGESFAATAAAGLPTSAKFKAIPGVEGDIWLAGGRGGLWHSTDSGASFIKLTDIEAADTIGFGMAAPGRNYMALYTSARIGGVYGIYRSDNAGASWVRINDDQHQYGSINEAITGDPRVYGRVYVSTNGRGIIYGDIDTSAFDFSLSADPSRLTIIRGANGTSTINVDRIGGFADSVSFSAERLPSGVRASFSPASTTGTSTTLTLTASDTAATGPSLAIIAGTGGGMKRTLAISLIVKAPPEPDFKLSAKPSDVTIDRGANETSTIAIARSGGFGKRVFLRASGSPHGVTAHFKPRVTSGESSTLTFTASSTAAAGPATITITGRGGGLVRTTSITLTVKGDENERNLVWSSSFPSSKNVQTSDP